MVPAATNGPGDLFFDSRPGDLTDQDRQKKERSLYDSRFEHDACGVGFVADLRARGGHDVVASALRVLCNLEHRGAAGADPDTGDGAGILTQIPDAFFRAVTGFALPEAGSYAAGLAFLSTDPSERERAFAQIADLAADEGLTVLGWRDVPVNEAACGPGARRGAAAPRPAVRGGRGGRERPRPRPDGVLPAQAGRARDRRLLRVPVQPDDRLQGHALGAAGRAVLPRPVRRALRVQPRPGSLPVLHQHVPVLAAGRTRTATSRTTARSTPCRATGTGCAPARRCSPRR